MKTLTIINTVLSSILIPILFSSIFFPNESYRNILPKRRVVCDKAHNATDVIVEDTRDRRAVLDDHFKKAIVAMRSKGYEVMASFLENQLLGFDMEEYSNDMFCVFAPTDEAVARAKVGFGELPLILLRYITSAGLSPPSDGLDLWRTFLPGFVVITTRYTDLVNCEVRIKFPMLYEDKDNELYVYGMPEILPPLTVEEVSKRRGGLLEPCVR